MLLLISLYEEMKGMFKTSITTRNKSEIESCLGINILRALFQKRNNLEYILIPEKDHSNATLTSLLCQSFSKHLF